jgi:hypothetical protein
MRAAEGCGTNPPGTVEHDVADVEISLQPRRVELVRVAREFERAQDGFRRLRLEGEHLTGEAWSPIEDGWVPFTLDVRTGRAEGGELHRSRDGARLVVVVFGREVLQAESSSGKRQGSRLLPRTGRSGQNSVTTFAELQRLPIGSQTERRPALRVRCRRCCAFGRFPAVADSLLESPQPGTFVVDGERAIHVSGSARRIASRRTVTYDPVQDGGGGIARFISNRWLRHAPWRGALRATPPDP